MARRRMFSLDVVDTDDFMEMPLSAQALYFHLGMRADDDGFVNSPRKILGMVGANRDDMKILVTKKYVLEFQSGIIVITHWKISNYIQKDRYRPTIYREEKSQLFLLQDGRYSKEFAPGAKPCLPPSEPPEQLPLPDVSTMDTGCIHSIGEDSLGEGRLGQARLGQVKYLSGDDNARAGEKALRKYLQTRGMDSMQYFGTTEELMAQVREITVLAFQTFASRPHTEADVVAVFQRIAENEINNASGKWTMSILNDRVDLLFYAFEQATLSGNPGNWNYINGVLGNLARRGITTLAEAEDYDQEHH